MYLAGYSPASCHAGSREVIPIFLLWAGQVSSCGPTPKFWQHSEQTHSFQGQFQLLPTWEANNIAERPTCIQLNAHNILVGLVGIWLLQVCEDSLIYTIWWGDQIQ